MTQKKQISVLFVCLSNICRSVALEGALKHLADQKKISDRLHVDSCGIGWYHLGEDPDFRMNNEALKRGIRLEHKAREIEASDFEEFDYILAATKEVLAELKKLAKTDKHKEKVSLATEFSAKYKGQDIPDPYYGASDSFKRVMDMSVDVAEGLCSKIIP
jgi:protein-tyrosine phosphatase